MKTPKYLLLTYFLPFFLILGCSKNDSDPLVGTWIYSESFNPYENYNVREGFEVIYTEEIRMTIREDYTGVWDYDLISSDSTELSSNEIVIIPNYNDFGRQAGIKINSKLGQGIADNVARRMITPIITRAISKVGVPGLNMDNVIIVDRERRAPR